MISTITRRVTPRPGSAELVAGLKVEGCKVVEVCFSILGGGLPIQNKHVDTESILSAVTGKSL